MVKEAATVSIEKARLEQCHRGKSDRVDAEGATSAARKERLVDQRKKARSCSWGKSDDVGGRRDPNDRSGRCDRVKSQGRCGLVAAMGGAILSLARKAWSC